MFTDPEDTCPESYLSSTLYAHGAEYWLAYANAYLSRPGPHRFWFILLSSMVHTLSHPLIPLSTLSGALSVLVTFSCKISWSQTSTPVHVLLPSPTGVLRPEICNFPAYYPLFIVDRPAGDEDDPLRKLNKQDRTTFILDAENYMHHHLVGGPRLSHLISNGYGIHLCIQAITFSVMYNPALPLLFTHVFGNEYNFSTVYDWALMESGTLKKDTERYENERKVWLEAREALGYTYEER